MNKLQALSLTLIIGSFLMIMTSAICVSLACSSPLANGQKLTIAFLFIVTNISFMVSIFFGGQGVTRDDNADDLWNLQAISGVIGLFWLTGLTVVTMIFTG